MRQDAEWGILPSKKNSHLDCINAQITNRIQVRKVIKKRAIIDSILLTLAQETVDCNTLNI